MQVCGQHHEKEEVYQAAILEVLSKAVMEEPGMVIPFWTVNTADSVIGVHACPPQPLALLVLTKDG